MRRQPDIDRTDPDEESELQSRVEIKKEYRSRELRGWIISLAAAVIIALGLRFFVFEFIRVDGPSMQPTLYTDEYVFMEKVTFWFRHPERGDIVICSFPKSNQSYVKRVICVPGDKVKVADGVLYINGVPDHEYFSGVYDKNMAELIVPENSVMVMGDNRNQSRDSRDPGVGPIPYNYIIGKAVFVIFPLDKIHGL
jgi:signal peptidase I